MSSQMNRINGRLSHHNGRWAIVPYALIGASALTLATAGAALAQTLPPPAPVAPPVNYTLMVSASGIKGSQGALQTEVDTNGAMQRYDTTVKLPNGNSFHLVNVLDCTADKIYTSDPALGIYTVNDSSQVRPEFFGTGTLLPSYTPDGRGLLFPLPDLIFAAQSGGVGANVTVTDKGAEAVGKTKNAEHYTVAFTYSTSGAAQVPYATQTFDVWTDPAQKQPTNCIAGRLVQAGSAGQGASVGGVTYTLTGDVSKLNTVLTGVPVQMTYDTGGAAGTITYTLDKLSTKAAEAKLFGEPSGKMQEVSTADFGTREHAAILSRVQSSNNGVDDSSAGMRNAGPTTDPNTQGINVPRNIGGGE